MTLLPFKDIPQALLEEVGVGLQHYFVSILGLHIDDRDYPLRLIGSGTLVRIDMKYCVLTAAHVWQAAEEFPAIGLSLTSYEAWFQIHSDHIVARPLGSDFGAFGPDLALLELPRISVGRIEAHKTFLDLVQQRQAFLTDPWELDWGIWAVTGMSAEESNIDTQPEQMSVMANVHGRAFFSGVREKFKRGEWDYIDSSADLALVGVPSTFGGVSGGGLWQVPLAQSKETNQVIWPGRKRFQGVAYWQTWPEDNHRLIRCHGPESIFQAAWEAWGLPG